MIPPLPQRHHAGIFPLKGQLRRAADAVLQPDALGEAPHHFLGHRHIDGDPVLLRHVLFGGQYFVRQRTVIGQDHQPGGVLIQPPRREQLLTAVFRRHQLQHRFIPGVPRRGNIALRLIQHKGQCALYPQRLPRHRDLLLPGDLALRVLFHPAVHRHPAPGDELLHLPPGKHPL